MRDNNNNNSNDANRTMEENEIEEKIYIHRILLCGCGKCVQTMTRGHLICTLFEGRKYSLIDRALIGLDGVDGELACSQTKMSEQFDIATI